MSGTRSSRRPPPCGPCARNADLRPRTKYRPRPIASGTVRMSENRIAASSGKRSSGCRVTSRRVVGMSSPARESCRLLHASRCIRAGSVLPAASARSACIRSVRVPARAGKCRSGVWKARGLERRAKGHSTGRGFAFVLVSQGFSGNGRGSEPGRCALANAFIPDAIDAPLRYHRRLK